MELLRPLDCLVVYSLSRLGRSTMQVLKIAAELKEREINLVVLDKGIDTTTPIGKFFFTLVAALDEFEAEQLGERTRVALEAPQSQRHKGRPAIWVKC